MIKKSFTKLSPEQVSAIAQSVADVISNLPSIGALTVDDRKRLNKLGPGSLQFVQQSVDVVNQNPDLLPGFVNKEELIATFDFYNQMLAIHLQVKQVDRLISDLRMESGSSAYSSSLSAYRSIKNASNSNVEGAQSVYDALKPRFKNGRRRRALLNPGFDPEAGNL